MERNSGKCLLTFALPAISLLQRERECMFQRLILINFQTWGGGRVCVSETELKGGSGGENECVLPPRAWTSLHITGLMCILLSFQYWWWICSWKLGSFGSSGCSAVDPGEHRRFWRRSEISYYIWRVIRGIKCLFTCTFFKVFKKNNLYSSTYFALQVEWLIRNPEMRAQVSLACIFRCWEADSGEQLRCISTILYLWWGVGRVLRDYRKCE